MTIIQSVIDIGEEVIKFAHDQGHTKAHKDVINWNKLETRSGKPKFTILSRNKTSVSYNGKVEETYHRLAKHLRVEELKQFTEEPISGVAALEQNDTASYFFEEPENIIFHENFLLNKNEGKKLCKVTFDSLCKNTADAFVCFTATLLCSKEDISQAKENSNLNEKNVSKNGDKKPFPQRRKSTQADCYPLTKISLSPKFLTSLSLKTVSPRKISLPKKDRHEVVANIPPGIKVPVEIIHCTEEEKGVFEVDYYLWGFAQVTVWGKPYKLLVTDILDTKNNGQFSRETICVDSTSNEEVQAVRVTLHGTYETRKTFNEIQLRIPKCILRRPSYSLESLKCTCDTCQLPSVMEKENILPLTDKNLARIIFRWREILYSFRSKHSEDQNEWLWKVLLENDTELAKVADRMKIDELCRESTATDKFVLTMLLWREKCGSLELLGTTTDQSNNLKELTAQLTRELYEVGIPVPVFSFLWKKKKMDKASEKLYSCPVHQFAGELMVKLDNLKGSNASKMLASLPDRVLLRLLQRWPEEDGWLPIALHLGVDYSNIKSLACKHTVFKTIYDKRLAVFKLWRMHHRRNSASSSAICNQSSTIKSTNCTNWDLCLQLHEMGMPKSMYNFLWLDTETTP